MILHLITLDLDIDVLDIRFIQGRGPGLVHLTSTSGLDLFASVLDFEIRS